MAAIQFTDFNFKLLVLQDLMYDQELVEPFDLSAHAEENGIDLEDHLGEPIEGAREFYEAYEVTPELAAKVTELVWDGGNDIFHDVVFQWDGEDDYFDVKTVIDALQLPNLESVTLMSLDGVNGIDELQAAGVEVEAEF